MGDFPDAAKRLLNMMEWWLCMSMPTEEVEQIARFRDLTEEEKALLLAAGKEPGKYAEGVPLSRALSSAGRSRQAAEYGLFCQRRGHFADLLKRFGQIMGNHRSFGGANRQIQ